MSARTRIISAIIQLGIVGRVGRATARDALGRGFDPFRQRPRGVAVDFGPKHSGWLINQMGDPRFLVNAPPAFRIDVVGPDPPPGPSAPALPRLSPILRRPAPPRSPSRPRSSHPSLHGPGGLTPSHWDPGAPQHGWRCAGA